MHGDSWEEPDPCLGPLGLGPGAEPGGKTRTRASIHPTGGFCLIDLIVSYYIVGISYCKWLYPRLQEIQGCSPPVGWSRCFIYTFADFSCSLLLYCQCQHFSLWQLSPEYIRQCTEKQTSSFAISGMHHLCNSMHLCRVISVPQREL